MNHLSVFGAHIFQFGDAPSGLIILIKITVLLLLAWSIHFILLRFNPRWRVLLWRTVAVGTIAIPLIALCLPAIEVEVEIPVELPEPIEPPNCRCGDVLKGLIEPPSCPLFGRACNPDRPVGACMVSSEGSCAAWYRHERTRSPGNSP